MDKKKLVLLITSVVVAAALIIVFFAVNPIDRAQQTSLDPASTATAAEAAADTPDQTGAIASENSLQPEQSNGTAAAASTSSADSGETLINSEKVDVSNNTPEYELSLELCENSGQKSFIRLKYYLNGSTVVNELDEGSISELAGIFESRAKESGSSKAFRISQALLNPVRSQLYILIQSAPFEVYLQSSFYVINLNDTSIKKLFSYPGLYGKMAFNKDFSLLAYSFGDPPAMSVYREDNLLEVLDCSTTNYIIKGNAVANGKKLGSNSSPDLLYDYEFEAWQSVDILRLKQAVRPLDDQASGLVQTEVLYNIGKNLLLNPDGSEQKPPAKSTVTKESQPADVQPYGTSSATGGAMAEDPAARAETVDSEPVKVLKSFYSCLGSGNDYAKAMQLLDDSFKLRMEMIRQFGAEELVKSDIDEESVSAFSNILKSASFESLSKEITKGSASTIIYTQVLGSGTDFEDKRQMTAELKKTGDAWKIILIEDGLK